ncbi:hypothetical protein F5X97DRAFT_334493 [Nemania serpens]|nr:hypothetical protein F5X97DRAFT_334493 [Nemania serpens]
MLRRSASYLQFSDPPHFVAWATLSGILGGFSLWRLRFLDFRGVFCGPSARDVLGPGALPGECFYFLRSRPAEVGIRAHLALVLPAALLACLQFVPRIRRRAAALHRVSGYASLLLGVLGAVAALPTVRHAFGGDVAAQAAAGTMMILFVAAQIRGYMMRSWVYGAAIITVRVVMLAASYAVSALGDYHAAQPCDKIDFVLGGDMGRVLGRYPGCAAFYSGRDRGRHVAARADIASADPVEVLTAFNVTYGMSSWVALMIHVVGVELYLRLSAEGVRHRREIMNRDERGQIPMPGSETRKTAREKVA